MNKKRWKYILWDILLVFIVYLFCDWLKSGRLASYLPVYRESMLIFILIWLVASITFKKYHFFTREKFRKIFNTIVLSNIFAFALTTSIMYTLQTWYFSRFMVIGTIGIATTLELIYSYVYYWITHARIRRDGPFTIPSRSQEPFIEVSDRPIVRERIKRLSDEELKSREEAILNEISLNAYEFIFNYAAFDSPNTLIVSTTSRFNIDTLLKQDFEAIVNLKRINDIRRINKFFEAVNAKLPVGGIFIDFVETKNLRKHRILRKYPPGLNYIFYSMDYLIKRVFPKFALTKGIYFFLTRGQNRVLTKAETFGRLYSCGFEVLDEQLIDNHLFFISIKVKKPMFPKKPTYGPFIALERIGKNGKIIKVYKMRTMHPYAEYLQEYTYRKLGLQDGGKFKNDFRISNIGRIMRKLWLDELPMIINWFKGEMKLVGVRPLSKHYYDLYSKELQQKRIKFKPGLIPPFYVDSPTTLQEIMDSEMKYLEAYEKHPFFTDIKYFFIAIYNILIKRYRSN